MIELLTDNHFDKILDLFDSARKEIRIISPFLAVSMAEKLCEAIEKSHVKCIFITRFYLEDMIAKASSLDALELLVKNGVEVYIVKKLHTKLYLFDQDNAILGSANFTNGGFRSNIELSLLINGEEKITEELRAYFDDMAGRLKTAKDGTLTADMLAKARKSYMDLFQSKKGKGKIRSALICGAVLDKRSNLTDTKDIWEELDKCEGEEDLICTLFREMEREEQIKYPYTIWLKFAGEGDDRLAGDEPFPMTAVTENGSTYYLSNYPYRAGAVKDGDEIYLAGLTTDKRGKNQPVIVGRGHLAGFSEENVVSDEMIRQYGWMKRYPWYCVITDCEVTDAPLKEGLPLDAVWDALGSDTYIASYGRGEDIAAVARKHYQKAHIRLSGNAKQYIDRKLDELKGRYGVVRYESDVGEMNSIAQK